MNAWLITLFMLGLQAGILLVGVAQIAIACDVNNQNCIYFAADIISLNSMSDVLTGQIETNQYKATQLETNIFITDTYNIVSTTLNPLTVFLYSTVFGLFSFITFVFGSEGVGFWAATVIQVLVYFFYGRALWSMIKGDGTGNIK